MTSTHDEVNSGHYNYILSLHSCLNGLKNEYSITKIDRDSERNVWGLFSSPYPPPPPFPPPLCQNGNKVTNHLMPFIIQDFRIYFGNRIHFVVSILQTCLAQYNSSYWIFAFRESASALLHFHQFSAPFSTLDKNTIFTTLTILLLSLPLPRPRPLPLPLSVPVPVPLHLLLLLAVVMMIIIIIIMWFRRPIQVWWARRGARCVVRPQKRVAHILSGCGALAQSKSHVLGIIEACGLCYMTYKLIRTCQFLQIMKRWDAKDLTRESSTTRPSRSIHSKWTVRKAVKYPPPLPHPCVGN